MADSVQTQEAEASKDQPTPPVTTQSDEAKPVEKNADSVQTQEKEASKDEATPPAPTQPDEVKPVEQNVEQTHAVVEEKKVDKTEESKEENLDIKKEVNKEVTVVASPAPDEVKPTEEVKQVEVSQPEEKTVKNGNTENSEAPKQGTDDWQQRELALLKKIAELEKIKNERSEDGLRLELKVREEEIDLLKARVRNLETELQAAMSKPGGKNHEMIEKIKQQHEELLSKARGMIFDKTKMVKNQELQIEALGTQVHSLKDINQITKDLLEIRNAEVKAMEDRFQALEARFKAEKERHQLVVQRAQTSSNINDDLKKEYETQLAIFKELREKYELRVQALVAENNRLKDSLKGEPSG